MAEHYYDKDVKPQREALHGLKKELLESFGTFNSKVFEEGALSKKEKELIRPFLVKKAKLSDKITGTVVSAGSGKVKGRVKILLSPRNLEKMKKGDILVAPMTSPDYIVAIRKAAAIVTDEGGLTCHAAIVSRELGIPCIVGTKIATKILKDDDKVEVNANHGVVYIRD